MIQKVLSLKLFRFLVVGVTAFIVDAGSLYILLNVVKLSLVIANIIVVANVISVTLGLFTSYLLNRIWTFEAKKERVRSQFIRFIIVFVSIYIVNQLLFGFLHVQLEIDALVTKVIVTFLQMFASFLLYNYFVFTPQPNVPTT